MRTVPILILLLLPLASAEIVITKHTNDFTLASPNNEQLKLCACETRVDTVIVENVGDFAARFTLIVETDWPGTVALAETEFQLAPGEDREIPVYVSDSCGIQGVYSYIVRAVNSYGREEVLARTIRSDPCENTRLEVSPDQEVGLCRPANFTVTVVNTGRHAETYHLNVQPERADVTIPVQALYLEPGTSLTQEVTVVFPCDVVGGQPVPFVVTSDRQPGTTSVARTLTILDERAFSLELGTRVAACAQAVTRVPLAVQNPIHAPEHVTITLQGAEFATFADGRSTEVTVPPYGEASLQLELSPAEPGSATLAITATDGGSTKTRDLEILVERCYDLALELRETPDSALSLPDVRCCGPAVYYVHVTNSADREQTVQLDLDGPSLFLLAERTLRLEPGQSANVPIHADLPCADGTYQALVTAYPAGHPERNTTSLLEVESLTERTCRMVQIDEDELLLPHGQTTLEVRVRHTGVRAGTYALTVNDTLFTFVEEEVPLGAGGSAIIHLARNARLEPGRYLVFPTFTVDGLSYTESVGVEVRGPTPWERLGGWLAGLTLWRGCALLVLLLGVVLLALLTLLLLTYLGRITPLPSGLLPQTLGLLRTLFVAAILVLAVAFLLAPPPDEALKYERPAESSPTVLEWYEGESLAIDLEPYFEDPDLDVLAFNASQPEHVRVRIEGGLMTLTPDEGFAGEDTLVVTASDGKGGTATSPMLALRVIPERELSLGGWLSLWCWQLIILLLMGILVVLLLFVLGVRERRQDLKSQNVVVVVSKKRRRARVHFYASKTGTKAHRRGCMALAGVRGRDLVEYKSRTGVLKAGLALCSICTGAESRNPTKRMRKRAIRRAARGRTATARPAKKRTPKSLSASRKPARAAPRRVKVASKRAEAVPETPSKKDQQVVNIQVNIAKK